MKSKAIIRIVSAVIILGIICGLAAYFAPHGREDSQAGIWYSIIPPVLAILLAFLTRHVLLSMGIIS
ncbi:MAG: hypothetical protein ACYTFW_22680 [Planctomycetota bacterium]